MIQLKDFIHENIVKEGYGLSYDLSKDNIRKLKDMCEQYLALQEKEDLVPKLNYLIDSMDKIVDLPTEIMDWDEKYNKIFSDNISYKFCRYYRELTTKNFEWFDPDCDYQDDVLAFYSEVKLAKEEINNGNW